MLSNGFLMDRQSNETTACWYRSDRHEIFWYSEGSIRYFKQSTRWSDQATRSRCLDGTQSEHAPRSSEHGTQAAWSSPKSGTRSSTARCVYGRNVVGEWCQKHDMRIRDGYNWIEARSPYMEQIYSNTLRGFSDSIHPSENSQVVLESIRSIFQ